MQQIALCLVFLLSIGCASVSVSSALSPPPSVVPPSPLHTYDTHSPRLAHPSPRRSVRPHHHTQPTSSPQVPPDLRTAAANHPRETEPPRPTPDLTADLVPDFSLPASSSALALALLSQRIFYRRRARARFLVERQAASRRGEGPGLPTYGESESTFPPCIS